jgi:hypothetical protein
MKEIPGDRSPLAQEGRMATGNISVEVDLVVGFPPLAAENPLWKNLRLR